ncbi:MAG: hypothetical protein R3C56_30215 [Pirellulaceae bacterium]
MSTTATPLLPAADSRHTGIGHVDRGPPLAEGVAPWLRADYGRRQNRRA